MAASHEERKAHALRLIDEHLAPGNEGTGWPFVPRTRLITQLKQRVANPDVIFQAQSNLCENASFMSALAASDPVQYVWFAVQLFNHNRARLGRGHSSVVIEASPEIRYGPVWSKVAEADWMVLAPLRDHFNKIIRFRLGAQIPVVREIPLVRLFSWAFAQEIASITWPRDVETLLTIAGFKNITNEANTLRRGGYDALQRASSLFAAGYQVFLYVSNGMFKVGNQPEGWNPIKGVEAAPTLTVEHWVRLAAPLEENEWAFRNSSGQSSAGVRCTVFDPMVGRLRSVPSRPGYVTRTLFLNHFYGFVAGRP